MYEVESKFRIHPDNHKVLIDRLLAINFKLDKTYDARSIYIKHDTRNILKIDVLKSLVSDNGFTVKTEYTLVNKFMTSFEEQSKIKTLPKEIRYCNEETITKSVANHFSKLSQDPLNLYKTRQVYKIDPPENLSNSDYSAVQIFMDLVSGLGKYDGPYMEFKVEVDDTNLAKKARRLINEVKALLSPFVGEFEENSYIQLIKKAYKEI